MKAHFIFLSLLLSLNSLLAIEPIYEKYFYFNNYPYLKFSDDFKTLIAISGHKADFYNTETWFIKKSLIIPDSIKNNFIITTDGKFLISLYNGSSIPNLSQERLKVYAIPSYNLIQDHIFYGGGFPYNFSGIDPISTDSFFLMTYSIKDIIYRGEETQYSGYEYNPYDNTLHLIGIYKINATDNIGNKFIGSNIIYREQYPAGGGYSSSRTTESYFFEKNGRNMIKVKPIEFYDAKILSNNNLLRLLDTTTIIYSDSNSIISNKKIWKQKSNYVYTKNLIDFHVYEDKNLIFAVISSNDKDSLYILHFPTRMIVDKLAFQEHVRDMKVSPNADSIFIFEIYGHMSIFSLKSYLTKNPIDIACDRRETIVNQNIKFFPLFYDTCKSYKWDFGDGTTINEKEPVHAYKNIGKYTVSLEVQQLDETYKKIKKIDFINVIDIWLDSSPQIKLLWANEVKSYSGNNFQYSSNGKTLGFNNLDNIVYIFDSRNGNLSFEMKYPESITSCLLSDNNNLVFIPAKNHDNEENKDTMLRINLSNNKIDSLGFVRKSCMYDFNYTNKSNYSYLLVPTPDSRIANLLFRISCSSYYDYMTDDLIYNFDFNKKQSIPKDIGFVSILDNKKSYFADWNYVYNYGTTFYKVDYSLWTNKRIAEYNGKQIYPKWMATKYHNNDLLVYNDYQENILLYFKTIDSSWTMLKSVEDSIYKFQNIKRTDNFLMIGKDGVIIIFDPEKDSVLQRIRVVGELSDLVISPTDSQFSVITNEGLIYTFASSFISHTEPEPEEKRLFVFPNPAHDKIHIKLNEEQANNKLQIYSPVGVLIFETDAKTEIDISSLPVGVYFLKIGNNFNKFIKVSR